MSSQKLGTVTENSICMSWELWLKESIKDGGHLLFGPSWTFGWKWFKWTILTAVNKFVRPQSYKQCTQVGITGYKTVFVPLFRRSKADHFIVNASLFLTLCSLLFLSETMEEAANTTETPPAVPILLERQVRQRKPAVSVLKSKLKQAVTCSVPRIQSTLSGFFPVMRWLPKYNVKEYVWGDVMSGMIVGIILVPQAIAYCLLAGVEPIYGLYTSFYANIIYFLMGTSRHVSVGIFSLMSLMIGQVINQNLVNLPHAC